MKPSTITLAKTSYILLMVLLGSVLPLPSVQARLQLPPIICELSLLKGYDIATAPTWDLHLVHEAISLARHRPSMHRQYQVALAAQKYLQHQRGISSNIVEQQGSYAVFLGSSDLLPSGFPRSADPLIRYEHYVRSQRRRVAFDTRFLEGGAMYRKGSYVALSWEDLTAPELSGSSLHELVHLAYDDSSWEVVMIPPAGKNWFLENAKLFDAYGRSSEGYFMEESRAYLVSAFVALQRRERGRFDNQIYYVDTILRNNMALAQEATAQLDRSEARVEVVPGIPHLPHGPVVVITLADGSQIGFRATHPGSSHREALAVMMDCLEQEREEARGLLRQAALAFPGFDESFDQDHPSSLMRLSPGVESSLLAGLRFLRFESRVVEPPTVELVLGRPEVFAPLLHEVSRFLPGFENDRFYRATATALMAAGHRTQSQVAFALRSFPQINARARLAFVDQILRLAGYDLARYSVRDLLIPRLSIHQLLISSEHSLPFSGFGYEVVARTGPWGQLRRWLSLP